MQLGEDNNGYMLYDTDDLFITNEKNVRVYITVYTEDRLVKAIEVDMEFFGNYIPQPEDSQSTRVEFLGIREISNWNPNTTLIEEIKAMVLEKYSENIENNEIEITHNCFTLNQGGRPPSIYFVLRDQNSNALVLKWEHEYGIACCCGHFYLRYAVGEFFDHMWNEGESQAQLEAL